MKTLIGRMRILTFLEGMSLLILVFITVPMKYIWDMPQGSAIVGPIHGLLFVAYVYYTFIFAAKYNWSFFGITWKVLVASFIPFGTFYVDKHFLQPLNSAEKLG